MEDLAWVCRHEDEIRVTSMGSVSGYVTRANTVFTELEKPKVVIKAPVSRCSFLLQKPRTPEGFLKRSLKGF